MISSGCHQHPPRPAPRSDRRARTAASPPRPLRGPHPRREGHRPAESADARVRPEPHLVHHRPAGLRTPDLDPDARLPRARSPAAGNPRSCGCDCSPPPDASPTTREPSCSTSPPATTGPSCCSPVGPRSPRPPPDPADRSHHSVPDQQPLPARGTGDPHERGGIVLPAGHHRRHHRPPRRATIINTKVTKDPGQPLALLPAFPARRRPGVHPRGNRPIRRSMVPAGRGHRDDQLLPALGAGEGRRIAHPPDPGAHVGDLRATRSVPRRGAGRGRARRRSPPRPRRTPTRRVALGALRRARARRRPAR